MTLAHKKNDKWNYLILSFALPVFAMLILMMIAGVKPFGERTFLYSDAWHQYYPFFLNYRQALRSGESILYNWDLGMGMDYLGLISYYLASPLNLLSVLIPESGLLTYFTLLTPIRMGLASLFFAIFLKELFRKEDISIVLFGSLYAFCAWSLGYRWNVMWMDTFALLPLVVLGMVKLLRDKKFILYTLALFQSIYSNYYVGFFVCIFVFLLFFCYEICRWRGWKRFFADLGRIAFFSALAIGMTAILELPTLAALQTTQSSVNNFPEGFKLNIAKENTLLGLLDAMRQVAGNLGGGIEPTWKEGLPNIYCGVGTLLLAFLFLLSRDVKVRDKICAVLLLIFFMLSFIIRQLDYIWHGFHFTNMIPYRFSFLFSFVLLYMAYRAWIIRHKFDSYQIAIAGILTADLLALSNDLLATQEIKFSDSSLMTALGFGDVVWEIPLFLIFNVTLLTLYLGGLFYGRYRRKLPADADELEIKRRKAEHKQRRIRARRFLAGVMALEIGMTLVNFGTTLSYTRISNYPKGTTYAASMIRYMKEREEDNLFFRAEVTHAQTLNDDALNDYAGISAFTSSANVSVTQFMKALGYGAKNTYNRYCWEEASLVSNLFLNLKYMIERDDRERGSSVFEDLHSYGNVHLLENNYYLPLGFLAESELAQVDFFAEGNVFNLQNKIFTAATGVTEDVWHRLPGSALTITGDGVQIKDSSSSGYCSYSDATAGSTVTYHYVADRDGFMCVNVDLPKRNDVSIRYNGTVLYDETTSLAQMMAVCDVTIGDEIEIVMKCDASDKKKGTMTLTAAILNMDYFDEGYEVLNASTLELTEFSNTRVQGTIDCNRDGLLYTSIPQNGNWSTYVDGNPVEYELVGSCMIALELTQGTHEVTFVYENAAFSLGCKISLACAAVFAALVMIVYKPDLKKLFVTHRKKRKGKYEK